MPTSTTSDGASWVPRTEKRASTVDELEPAERVGGVDHEAGAHGEQDDGDERDRPPPGHAEPTSSATRNSDRMWNVWSTEAARPASKPLARLTRVM